MYIITYNGAARLCAIRGDSCPLILSIKSLP